MMRRAPLLAPLLLAACIGTPPSAEQRPGPGMGPGGRGMDRGLPPPLPEREWGIHVLALARAPDGALWAGTHGAGVFVLRPDTARWDQLAPSDEDSASIMAGQINSIAFARDGAIWLGTAGGGFGRSLDGGLTWRKWSADATGPQWQYVAAGGMAAHGDTIYVATSDGLRMTWDGGERWRCVVSDAEDSTATTEPADDGCTERVTGLPTEYLFALDVMPDGTIWVGHLEGVSRSEDGGMTWRHLDEEDGGVPRERVRAVAVDTDSLPSSERSSVSSVWVATETDIYVDSTTEGTFQKASIELPGWRGSLPGSPRAIVPSPGELPPSLAMSYGMAVSDLGGYRVYYLATGDRYRPAADMWAGAWWGPPWWPLGASAAGINRILGGEATFDIPGRVPAADAPAAPEHAWFARPIARSANPYVDAAALYGSTAGYDTVQRSGISFNNPAGTAVRAIGDGTVVFAGPSGTGSNTVAIRHDRRWLDRSIFSAYHHNSAIEVSVGQQVREGDVIAQVGNTGRTTNDRLGLEVHIAPTDDAAVIVNAEERFPQYAVNPQLWIEPLPGTGIVAGRVLDSSGEPVRGAKVYGLVLPYPAETPFSYVQTYGESARPDPAYGEHFVVGDVPAGDYRLGVDIGGSRVWRRVHVEEGQVTFVEFEP